MDDNYFAEIFARKEGQRMIAHLGLLWLALWAGQGQATAPTPDNAEIRIYSGSDIHIDGTDPKKVYVAPGVKDVHIDPVAAPKPETLPLAGYSTVIVAPDGQWQQSINGGPWEPVTCDELDKFFPNARAKPEPAADEPTCDMGKPFDCGHGPSGMRYPDSRRRAKPEPSVVPAIQEERDIGPHGACVGDNKNWCADIVTTAPIAVWSCKDKSRVLLTTEDGKHICVKFGDEK